MASKPGMGATGGRRWLRQRALGSGMAQICRFHHASARSPGWPQLAVTKMLKPKRRARGQHQRCPRRLCALQQCRLWSV